MYIHSYAAMYISHKNMQGTKQYYQIIYYSFAVGVGYVSTI